MDAEIQKQDKSHFQSSLSRPPKNWEKDVGLETGSDHLIQGWLSEEFEEQHEVDQQSSPCIMKRKCINPHSAMKFLLKVRSSENGQQHKATVLLAERGL